MNAVVGKTQTNSVKPKHVEKQVLDTIFGRRGAKVAVSLEVETDFTIRVFTNNIKNSNPLLTRRVNARGKVELRLIIDQGDAIAIHEPSVADSPFRQQVSRVSIYQLIDGALFESKKQLQELKHSTVHEITPATLSISAIATNAMIEHILGADNLITLKPFITTMSVIIRDSWSYLTKTTNQPNAMYQLGTMGESIALNVKQQREVLLGKELDLENDKTYIALTDNQMIIVCKDREAMRDKLRAIVESNFVLSESTTDSNFRFSIYPNLTDAQAKILLRNI